MSAANETTRKKRSAMSIRVSIVEDNNRVRGSLSRLIELSDGFQCVSQHSTGEDAVAGLPKACPDVVLMDINLPGMNGVTCVRQIKPLLPKTQIVMLTVYENTDLIFQALSAGASGYLLKDTPRQEVVKAIKGTVAGKSFVDPAIAGKFLNQVVEKQSQPSSLITDKLTGREVDVLCLLAGGLNNADIAKRLHLSEGTVRNHVSAIFAKLDVSDRTQAAVIAIQHGLGNG